MESKTARRYITVLTMIVIPCLVWGTLGGIVGATVIMAASTKYDINEIKNRMNELERKDRWSNLFGK